MKRKKLILIVILGVALISLAAMLVLFVTSNSARPTTSKQEMSEEGSIEDRLANIPKDAQSDVCDTLSSDKIASAVGQAISSARPSIKTTQTQDGSVSACTYVFKHPNNDPLVYLVVTTRTFNDASKSRKSFDIVATSKSAKLEKINEYTVYNKSVAQFTILSDKALTTVNIERSNKDKPLKKELLSALIKLFNSQ